MSDDIYLEDYLYHMVRFSNLESILHRGALLSKEKVQSEGIKYDSIAEESVQELRDRVYVWDSLQRQRRSIHSYVPFYFAKRTPMLSKLREIQHEIIFFEISRFILKDPGVIFTNGNAANQQLAKFGTETVYIAPATPQSPLCRRKYAPDGPWGTNSNCSDFYSDLGFLRKLDWPSINSDQWGGDPEKKRIKHAEVLIPDRVPLSKIESIYTLTQEKANSVNMLIKRYGLEGRLPRATRRPDLYFQYL